MERLGQLIRTRTLYITLIVIVSSGFHYYDTSKPELTFLMQIFNEIGFIVYILWLIGISYFGTCLLIKKGLELNSIKNLKIYFIVAYILSLYLGFSEADTTITREFGGIYLYFSSQTPISFLYVTLYLYGTYRTAQLIKTLESNREVVFKEFYKTWLLLIFSVIGIIFLHGKVRTILEVAVVSSEKRNNIA